MLKQMRYSLAKRQCKEELSTIIVLMEGHKAVSLPPGHEYYQILERRAESEISKLQDKATSLQMEPPSYEDIAAGIPMLRELKQLATGKMDGAAKTAAGVVGLCVMGSFIFTVLLALLHDVYVIITHFVRL